MLKAMGFSDARLASLTKTDIDVIQKAREKLDVHPVYKRIDTCAAEFASPTAYMTPPARSCAPVGWSKNTSHKRG